MTGVRPAAEAEDLELPWASSGAFPASTRVVTARLSTYHHPPLNRTSALESNPTTAANMWYLDLPG